VTRRQLLAAGISSAAIDGMLKRGLVRRIHRGVYAVFDGGQHRLARETAALLACGEGAVLSHRSAAALWDLTAAWDGPVDVMIADCERGRKRSGIRLHRATTLLPRDIRIHHNVPVTSPAKTLLDLAANVSARDLERALDEALVVRQLVREHEVADVLAREPHHRGTRVMKGLLSDRGSARITHSEAERLFMKLVRDAGLPLPEVQVQIAGYRVDFFWPQHGVAFEVDGYRFHTSRSAFNRDRSKDAALKAVRVDPNRVSRDQVKFEPLTVVNYVTAALTRAMPASAPR
jgi:very-short-patch-repair endonuclease